jgi:hypothetical protein
VFNEVLQTYDDVSDGTERWLAFHGHSDPTEVGTDHSGLPDPSSHTTHHVGLDLADPDLVVRADDAPSEGDDTVADLVRALNVKLNGALLDLSNDLLKGVNPKQVQDLLDERQQYGLAAIKPRFPEAESFLPREMYSTLVEVAVRRGNPNLGPLVDEDLREYLAIAAVAGDAERVMVGDPNTVTVGRYSDLPQLEIKDTFPFPDLTQYRPEAYYYFLMDEAIDGRFDPDRFVELSRDLNTDWEKEFDDYIRGKKDADEIRRFVRDRLNQDYARAMGPREPRYVITHLHGMRGHTYAAIVTKLERIQGKYGLSDADIAKAIHQVMLGDISPLNSWRVKGGRTTVINERNLMADLGRLVLVVEGSRHPSAMLTNAMNLVVGTRGDLKVPEFLRSYNSMMYKGANKAAAGLENRLTGQDPAALTTLEDLFGTDRPSKLDRDIMQTERASIAAYLRELLKPTPEGAQPLSVGPDPMTAQVLDQIRNGRVDDAVKILESGGNLKLFLRNILDEIITFTTTPPKRQASSP